MIDMAAMAPQTLDEYLAVNYPFSVIADPDGGYVLIFPDLPGCISQVDTLDDVGPVAEEIRSLWIETEYERGADIPPPSYPPVYSGKFNLRLPRSLHRRLAEAAERDGVSLNEYVVSILSAGIAAGTGPPLVQSEERLSRLKCLLNELASKLEATSER
jgi:predicted RNase H-like HicB family nuclease